MRNGGRRPGESYHVIHGTDVTCRHAYMYSHAREKTDLAFCTSYEDETSADGEQHPSVKNISELEGIAPKGGRTTCVKYLQ